MMATAHTATIRILLMHCFISFSSFHCYLQCSTRTLWTTSNPSDRGRAFDLPKMSVSRNQEKWEILFRAAAMTAFYNGSARDISAYFASLYEIRARRVRCSTLRCDREMTWVE